MTSKILVLFLILSVVMLSACIPQDFKPQEQITEEPAPITTPNEDETVQERSERLLEDNLDASFTLLGVEYVTSAPNLKGDESSVRRIAGTSRFQVTSKVKYKFTPVPNLKAKDLYLTIVDGTTEETVASQKLKEGEDQLQAVFTTESYGTTPRFYACFSTVEKFTREDVTCLQLSGSSVKSSFTTNSKDFGINFRRDVNDKTMYIQNNGNTVLTIFSYWPQGDDFSISSTPNLLTLPPGEEQTVEINADGTKSSRSEIGYFFALPNDCLDELSCVEDAKLKTEIDIDFND